VLAVDGDNESIQYILADVAGKLAVEAVTRGLQARNGTLDLQLADLKAVQSDIPGGG